MVNLSALGLVEIFYSAMFMVKKFIYTILFSGFARILDFIQLIFNKFAGLDVVEYEGKVFEGDILLGLVQNGLVKDIFISMCVLGIVLMGVSFIIAYAKSAWNGDDKGKPKILKGFVKAFVNVCVTPVFLLAGIIVGNGLLKSLDVATSVGHKESFSSRIFASISYNGNRARDKNSDFYNKYFSSEANEHKTKNNNFGIFFDESEGAGITLSAADKIDLAFSQNMPIPEQNDINGFFVTDKDGKDTVIKFDIGADKTFNYYDFDLVYIYYDMSNFDFIIGLVSMCILGINFGIICLSLIERIFIVLTYLMIMPLILAVSPLKNSFEAWRGELVSQCIFAYGTVIGVNLYFILMQAVQGINFFPTETNSITGISISYANKLIVLFIMCAGGLFLQTLVTKISKMIGGDNAVPKPVSKGLAGNIVSGVTGAATGVAGAVTGGIGGAAALVNKKFAVHRLDLKTAKANGASGVFNVHKEARSIAKARLNSKKEERMKNGDLHPHWSNFKTTSGKIVKSGMNFSNTLLNNLSGGNFTKVSSAMKFKKTDFMKHQNDEILQAKKQLGEARVNAQNRIIKEKADLVNNALNELSSWSASLYSEDNATSFIKLKEELSKVDTTNVNDMNGVLKKVEQFKETSHIKTNVDAVRKAKQVYGIEDNSDFGRMIKTVGNDEDVAKMVLREMYQTDKLLKLQENKYQKLEKDLKKYKDKDGEKAKKIKAEMAERQRAIDTLRNEMAKRSNAASGSN